MVKMQHLTKEIWLIPDVCSSSCHNVFISTFKTTKTIATAAATKEMLKVFAAKKPRRTLYWRSYLKLVSFFFLSSYRLPSVDCNILASLLRPPLSRMPHSSFTHTQLWRGHNMLVLIIFRAVIHFVFFIHAEWTVIFRVPGNTTKPQLVMDLKLKLKLNLSTKLDE